MESLYSDKQLQIINIYIGVKIRFERLKLNLSQHEVGVISGTDGTSVGRIERAEHISSWSKIFLTCQCLNIKYTELFVLKSKQELLQIVKDCHSLEKKLTKEKQKFYQELQDRIVALYK